MITRAYFSDPDPAQSLQEALTALGHEAEVVAERFAGEDDDEAIEYAVCTDAPSATVTRLVDPDTFIVEDD